METGHWLSLTDFASKYRVSVSTLRRKIKSGQVEHRFQEGKYIVLDDPTPLGLVATPDESVEESHISEIAKRGIEMIVSSTANLFNAQFAEEPPPAPRTQDQMLSELKRAYTNILHEKEEQIIELKAEVTDLKTLVAALEDDNQRMRRFLTSN